ncbi:MAG: ATP synthase F0 subunit B [Thermodesulfobacteriota bacterium]
MIEIDYSIIYQIIAFFVLLFVLQRFLYKPVFAVMEERKARTEGALKHASVTEEEVRLGLVEYEKRLKEAAKAAQEARSVIRDKALKKETETIEAARKETQEEIQKMRAEIALAKVDAIQNLKQDAKGFSKSIAEKILERSVAAILIAIVFMPSIVFASEGGGEENPYAMYWKVFNFTLLAIGIIVVWKKWISVLLDTRAVDIRKAIEDADRVKAEAEARLAEYKEKLALLENKVSEIKDNIRIEAEIERERIFKEAGESVRKLKEQVKISAEQEVKKAKLEIRGEVAEIAVEMAREILKRELKPDDQERILKGYTERLRVN